MLKINNIFIADKIKIGFQSRDDTYTQQLAYIIYYDQKGVLRKENSWNSWRDDKIEPMDFDNVPTEGFVLNKKVGGYNNGWNYRQSYVRVYDPRGFEFEITVPNLLYILENTSSIKGKGLEGEFVYGWDKKDLILIPTSSPDYKELYEFKTNLYNKQKFKLKDMILGATYLSKDNIEVVYLGRHGKIDYWDEKDLGKHYVFGRRNDYNNIWIESTKSLNTLIIKQIDSERSIDFNQMIIELNSDRRYDDIDSKTEYVKLSLDEFRKDLINNIKYIYTYNKYLGKWESPDISFYKSTDLIQYRIYDPSPSNNSNRWFCANRLYSYHRGTSESAYYNLNPHKKKLYLRNGDLWNE